MVVAMDPHLEISQPVVLIVLRIFVAIGFIVAAITSSSVVKDNLYKLVSISQSVLSGVTYGLFVGIPFCVVLAYSKFPVFVVDCFSVWNQQNGSLILPKAKPAQNNKLILAVFMHVATLVASVTANSDDNILCNTNDWNIISGTWIYNETSCSIDNTNKGSGYQVWFGSADGKTPNTNYSFNSFVMEAIFSINTYYGGDAGICFRAINVSAINNHGESYYIGLYPEFDYVIFDKFYGGNYYSLYKSYDHTFNASVKYNLTVQAIETVYNVWLDGIQIFTDKQLTDYTTGSVGLRNHELPATYYSITLTNLTAGMYYFVCVCLSCFSFLCLNLIVYAILC